MLIRAFVAAAIVAIASEFLYSYSVPPAALTDAPQQPTNMYNVWKNMYARFPILGLLLLLLPLYAESPSERRPNVLLLVADDCRAATGGYGGEARTPQLDALARRGLRFDRAYCQYPLCNPSRTSFLTGLRPDTSGVRDNETNFRTHHPDWVTLPQYFRQHGYFTARVGKLYHAAVPRQIGTDGSDDPASWEERSNPRGRDCDDEALIHSIVAGPQAKVATGTRNYGAILSWLEAEGEDDEQTDGRVAAAAAAILSRPHDRPFFLAVGFFRPHTPFVAPKPYFDRHPRERIAVAPFPPNDREDKPLAAFTVTPPHYGMDVELQRTVKQAYLASLSYMDAQVGHVLSALERSGRSRDTVVVFLSDHGYHLGEHGQWQKRSLFEDSARVPLIVAAPGLTDKGGQTAALTELVDLYPTLADLCGLPPPAGVEGISLKPVLQDPGRDWKKGAFTQVRNGIPRVNKNGVQEQGTTSGLSVRTARYRYTEWGGGSDGVELYDYQEDPTERVNRAADPAFCSEREALRLLLRSGWKGALPP